MSGYQIESCEINNSKEIASQWLDLQSRSSYSYFQSWSWIEIWLDVVVNDLQPIVIKIWSSNKLIGLGVFVSRDIKRRKVFGAKAMYLNEYPFDGRNMVTEFNGLLVEAGHEKAVYRESISYLINKFKEHDEFCFGAILENSPISSIVGQANKNTHCLVQEQSNTWHVDLTVISPNVEGYLASLSRNRRGQIRRSLKLYNKENDLQINVASNITDALFYFDRLKILHTKYWKSRGSTGSFANKLWERFHQELIKRRFDSSEIQLIQVNSASGEIGYIYNVIQRGHVYVIQTGFVIEKDKRLMPGYVAHTLVIAHNQKLGMKAYDFMHGDSLYKSILSNEKRTLEWLIVQRKHWKFTLENSIVGLKRKLHHLLSK